MKRLRHTAMIALVAAVPAPSLAFDDAKVREIVSSVVEPVMKEHSIPGMAVGVTVGGKHHLLNYGIASEEGGIAVTDDTLFEIGSISKTFTATLAQKAALEKKLSLDDPASRYVSWARGSAFDRIRLVDLATHSTGGLPLTFPDGVTDEVQMREFMRRFTPVYEPGTRRSYSNLGIGMVGVATAAALDMPFAVAMRKELFEPLGITRSYYAVPAEETKHYALGHTRQGAPIRMAPGPLDSEAYGLRSNTTDVLRFLDVQIGAGKSDDLLRRAVAATHESRFTVGDVAQGLIWESYAYPVSAKAFEAGNSNAMYFEAMPVTPTTPPVVPAGDRYFNKTGSTNGFAGYVAFIPSKKLGVVLLANKNYAIPARVAAGYRILSVLDEAGAK